MIPLRVQFTKYALTPFILIFYVYIIYSIEHDRFYIGQSNNINKRLIRHNKGYVRSTKPYTPWKIVHFEEFHSRAQAVNREKYLKSLKSKAAIRKLIDS